MAWVADTPDARLLDWNGSNQIPLNALPYISPQALLLGPHALAELPDAYRALPRVRYTSQPEEADVAAVLNDDREVGRMAAQALLERGYRRIAAVESANLPSRRRMSGFSEFMHAGNRPISRFTGEVRRPRHDENFSDVLAEYEGSFRAFVRGLRADTGIFCPLGAQATHLLALIGEESALSIPEELGVVVGDLLNPGTENSGMAHIHLNGHEIGRRACEILYNATRSGQLPEPCRIEIAPQGISWGRTLRPKRGFDLLAAMTAYCEPRLAEPIRVSEIAENLGLSRRSLELKLRTLGLPSPYEHLTQLRLQKGEQLLRESTLSIERVAELCGFSDTRSFTRRFRERYGCPPLRFRRQTRPAR